MQGTPPDINGENDDSVIALDSHDEAQAPKPFARKRCAARSVASAQAEKGNGAPQPFLPEPLASSSDSNDSAHIPGPSPSDAPRARRQNRCIQGVAPRRRNNQQNSLEDDIQSVSSSSDVEKPNSSSTPKPQKRRARKSGTDITYLEGGKEVRHQQDRPVGFDGRTVQERKRRADHTPRSTTPKRRSSRRVPSAKEEGIRQVKADRQRREACQGNKSSTERNSSPYQLRERHPPIRGPFSIEDEEHNEDDFIKYDANMEEPEQVNNVRSNSDCDEDLKYVPPLQKDHVINKKRSTAATTRTPRDVSEPDEVLSLDREEVAEEVKELNIDAPYSGPTHLIFEYPRGQKGKIRVTAEERGRLAEKKYLNDSLIDFFFKYQEIALQQRAPGLRLTAKFFSSFFFGRLRRTKPIDYEGVRGWTKDVDIFSKKFVFVPICDSYHWSLIIVANLHNLNDFLDKEGAGYAESERPRIVYLDSLDPSRGTAFGDSIRRYLVEEWLCRKKQLAANDARKKALLHRFKTAIPLLKAKVPLQTNEYDCGLYVLNSLEMFLNNDRCFMDDLLCGEDQVSDAYTHVDIQMLRERLVFLMDQFELDWRERSCPLSDEMQNKPRENGSSPHLFEFEHHISKQVTQESSVQAEPESQDPAELYSFIPERTSGSHGFDDEAELHAAGEMLGENQFQVNEGSTAAYQANGGGSVGDVELGKAFNPTGSAENPDLGRKIVDNSQVREEGLRSNPTRQAVEVGSASVSSLPEWSLKEPGTRERKSQTNCDFVDQRVHDFSEHREQAEDVEMITNEGILTQNDEYRNNEKNQEMPYVEISLDPKNGFSFQHVLDHKDEPQIGLHESQCVPAEGLEAVDTTRESFANSQNHLEVGYGGNSHHLRHGYARSGDPREVSGNNDEHAEGGIDIYENSRTVEHQLDGSRPRSPLQENRSSTRVTAEELQTVDHTGETKTYTIHITGSASDP